MIFRNDLRAARLFVGVQGCDLECLTPDGEVNWTVGYGHGIHQLHTLMQYMEHDDVLQLSGSGTVQTGRGRVMAQTFGAVAFESGANPDFRPTAYTEAEARMRKLVDQANATEKRIEKRLRAMQRAKEEVAEHRAEVLEPVEPEPAPAEPAPEPEAAAAE